MNIADVSQNTVNGNFKVTHYQRFKPVFHISRNVLGNIAQCFKILSNRNNVIEWIANPCTPVRFRASPPAISMA